ncbi:alpha/beta hydrolase [Streptomyces asoensis]|uniref:alpha/beta hydrolase n=1 Tax=Streptomyces asoensis TaxID=249586 RepID=UPI003406EAE5
MKKLLWSVAALAISGCLLNAMPHADAVSVAGGEHDSKIVWGPCPAAPANVQVDPQQTCGTLNVPLDYRQPRGKKIEIAVSRIPASDPAKRRGVLLLNPGGPGSEGLHLPSIFTGLTSEAVLATYDRIGFDPRGVGHSSPVTCGLTAAEVMPPNPYPASDGSIDKNVDYARSAAARCAKHSGDVLPYITTANTARDMDRIRKALGERKLSYWGGSYGTYLGAAYSSLFPHRTDRMVLDSAVDPTRIWYDEFRQQSAGMAVRFPDAARYAADHVDEIKLGSTPRSVTNSYLRLAARLDARPLTVRGTSTVLTGNVFRYMTYSLLYQDGAIPPMALAWRAAADLSDGNATDAQVSTLREILQVISPSAPTSPGVPKDNSIAAAYAIACGDVRWPRNVNTYAHNVAEDRKAFPLSAGFAANMWPCAFWPTAPVEPVITISDEGPRNIMILQNERDPATTLTSGRGMRRALGSRSTLVTVDAGGHGVYGMQGSGACANKTADAFLVRGVMPEHDVHCPEPRLVF